LKEGNQQIVRKKISSLNLKNYSLSNIVVLTLVNSGWCWVSEHVVP